MSENFLNFLMDKVQYTRMSLHIPVSVIDLPALGVSHPPPPPSPPLLSETMDSGEASEETNSKVPTPRSSKRSSSSRNKSSSGSSRGKKLEDNDRVENRTHPSDSRTSPSASGKYRGDAVSKSRSQRDAATKIRAHSRATATTTLGGIASSNRYGGNAVVAASRPGVVAYTGGLQHGKRSGRTIAASATAAETAAAVVGAKVGPAATPNKVTCSNEMAARGITEDDALRKRSARSEKLLSLSSRKLRNYSTASASPATVAAAIHREKRATSEKAAEDENVNQQPNRQSRENATRSFNGINREDEQLLSRRVPFGHQEEQEDSPKENVRLGAEAMAEGGLVTATDLGGEEEGGIQAFIAEREVFAATDVIVVMSAEEETNIEQQKFRKYICCGTICFILLAVSLTVPIAIVFGKGEGSKVYGPSATPSKAPTGAPTSAPTSLRLVQTTTFLVENGLSKSTDLDNLVSPQYQAAAWISDDDEVRWTFGDYQWIQRYRLATFYFATNGDAWTQCSRVAPCNDDESWLTVDKQECDWFGVSCSLFGQNVNGFSLSKNRAGNNLEGVIPEEFFGLTNLTSVLLQNNKLVGTLSKSWSKLSSLTAVALNINSFSGPIPEIWFENAPNLRSFLYLMNNPNLGGSLPTSIGLLANLERLDVGNTKIGGAIPEELFQLSSLRYLRLDQCSFTGKLSANFAQLTALKELEIEGNDISGEVTSEVCAIGIEILNVDCDKVACDCCKKC